MCRHPSGQGQQPEVSTHPVVAQLNSHMAGLIRFVAVLLAAAPCALAQYQQMATFFGGAPDGMDPSQPSFGLLDVSRSNPASVVCPRHHGTKDEHVYGLSFLSSKSNFELMPLLWLQGSCGFGALTNKNAWPFWSTVGISQSSPFYSNPLNGCGTCLQIQCNPSSSAFPQLAVSCCLLLCLLSHLQQHKGPLLLTQIASVRSISAGINAQPPTLQGNCISSSPITVVVTDTCPQCDANHLDISADAFAQVRHLKRNRPD